MKANFARLLLKAMQAHEHEDDDEHATLIEHYSGRGMFGKTTTALSCKSWSQVLWAVAEVGIDLGRQDQHTENPEYFHQDDFIDQARCLSSDSMGRGIVIY